VWLGWVAVALLIPACERGDRTAAPAALEPVAQTVVLATIDTWRRDAAGFLGASNPSPTPFLDGLAQGGLVAADAMAPVPLTAPSHWSILSGRWPWRDDVRVNGDGPREGSGPVLAEILRDAGWRTAAFVSCVVLDRRSGFAAGFEHYDGDFFGASGLADVEMAERRADETVRASLAWLGARGREERVFLWIHLFDPHFPYAPPGGALPGERGAYLGEVAFADAQLARLAAGLEGLGRPLDASLWVVLSDHGEGLGDHGEHSHGLILHGATTRIPFLVAGPSVPAGRFQALSSTVDVLPTILGLVGIAAPVSDGIDLVKGAAPAERAIPLESMMGARGYGLAPVWGLRVGRWLWESSPADHLWDLEADPAEEHDLGGELAERVAQLKRMRQQIGIPSKDEPQPHDEETIAKLRALGYVTAGSSAGPQDVRSVGLEANDHHSRLRARLAKEDYAGAEVLAREGVERYPRFLDLWINAGFVAVGLGDLAEAERRFRRAVDLAPGYAPARLNLANVLFRSRRLAEAEAAYREILEDDPDALHALYNLGAVLSDQGRKAEAAVPWRRFADLYPSHPKTAPVREALAGWAVPDGSD
jgi:arylsulfatase A-like enzyme